MGALAIQLGESRGYVRQDHSRDLPNRLHALLHSSPSSPKQHGAEDMGDTSTTRDRNLSVLRNQSGKSVQTVFSKHVTEPPKVVALKLAKAGAPISPHTVKAHQQRLPESMDTFFAYCRAYPGFALDALELMGIDLDLHRDAYAMFLQLQRTMQGRD